MVLFNTDLTGKKKRGTRAITVRAVRIELSTRVTGRDVNQLKIANACDLNIVGCLDEVGTSNSAIRYKTRAITSLDAPGHLDAFCLTNNRLGTWFGGRKETEVVYGVDYEMSIHDLQYEAKKLFRRTIDILAS